WLSDNNAKIPLIMDCGTFPPVLYLGSFAQVTKQGGLQMYKEAGMGKAWVSNVALNENVRVVDGPFCTRLSAKLYQIQWLVENHSKQQGYMLEGRPDGKGNYMAYTKPRLNTSAKASLGSGRPAEVQDQDIDTVRAIFVGVQSGKIGQEQAQSQL